MWQLLYLDSVFDHFFSIISGLQELLCDFHREQAWERWASTKNNALGHKDDILRLFRKVAMAKNTNAFHEALETLQSSEIWKKNQKLQKYFDRVWYPHHKVILVNTIISYIYDSLNKKASFYRLLSGMSTGKWNDLQSLNNKVFILKKLSANYSI